MPKKLLFIFMLLLAAGALVAQSKKLRPGFNLFSKEQDVQLGKESAAEVEKKMKVVDNPELQTYIGTVGKKLTSSADAGEFPYSFKVVVDKSINAFALPGGPMYIHTGLLAAADNESQMAGVMAHEVSHVALAARHQPGIEATDAPVARDADGPSDRQRRPAWNTEPVGHQPGCKFSAA